MQVYCLGEALIRRSGGAGEEFVVRPDDLDWEFQGIIILGPDDQRTEYAAFLQHPQLGQISWHLWEQPNGTQAESETDVGDHELLQDFDYGLQLSPDEEAERSAKVEAIVGWFQENYEDPAERTSYETAEGGYLWNHGGPFDAREEIAAHFEGLSDELIDLAVEVIESSGNTEWAGGAWWDELDGGPDDHEADAKFGIDQPLTDSEVFAPEDDEVPEEQDIAIPNQGPGLTFEVSKTGLIEIARYGSLEDGEEDAIAGLRSVLVSLTFQLHGLLKGTNAFGSLTGVVQQYSVAIAAADLSVDLLYCLGVRLENSQFRLQAQIDSGDLPTMGLEVGEMLDSVLALHGPLILLTAQGRKLVELAQQYAFIEAENGTYRIAAGRLAEAAGKAPDLVSVGAAETLLNANDNLGFGPHPGRSWHVAHSGNKNFLITVAKACAPILAAGLFAGLEASVPGVAFSSGVTLAANAAWNFLFVNAPILRDFVAASGAADMGWLQPMLRRVLSIGARG